MLHRVESVVGDFCRKLFSLLIYLFAMHWTAGKLFLSVVKIYHHQPAASVEIEFYTFC